MSYDPRTSGSPYLGMDHDPDDYERSSSSNEQRAQRLNQETPNQVQRPAQTPPRQGQRPAQAAPQQRQRATQTAPQQVQRPAQAAPQQRQRATQTAPQQVQRPAQAAPQQRQRATQTAPQQVQRPAQAAPRQGQRPVGSAAGRTRVRDIDELRNRPLSAPPVPSPSQRPYQEARPVRVSVPASGRAYVSGGGVLALRLASLVARILAILLSLLVVANAVLVGSLRAQLFGINRVVGSLIPPMLSGRLIYETPFGGVLRGDYIVCALVLFIIDWVLMRAAMRRSARPGGRL